MTDAQREEFIELLMPHRDRLMHFARGMTSDVEEARDLASDTILAALEGFERLRSHEAFLSYLFTIAVRIHRRRRWRRRLFGRNGEFYDLDPPDDAPAPDARVDVEALNRALTQLPEKMREAIVLHEISGLKVEEIREIQGGSLSGVKTRLSRGRQRLAEILGVAETSTEGNSSEQTERGRQPIPNNDSTYVLYTQSQTHG